MVKGHIPKGCVCTDIQFPQRTRALWERLTANLISNPNCLVDEIVSEGVPVGV